MIFSNWRTFFFSGYDVSRKVRAGWTGIMYAANFGHPEIVKLFIDSGANANFQKGIPFFPEKSMQVLVSPAMRN